MGFLKNIFKSKPGGTVVGNLLRSGSQIVKSVASAIPVVGPVIAKLPIGEGLMLKQSPQVQSDIISSIMGAASAPAMERPEALTFASAAKAQTLQATNDPILADKVGQATFEAAAAPKVHIDDLGAVLAQVTQAVVTEKPTTQGEPTQSQKETIKDVISQVAKGALQGAKSGAIEAFTKTDTGEQLEKDTFEVYFKKYFPWLAAAVAAYLLYKNKK